MLADKTDDPEISFIRVNELKNFCRNNLSIRKTIGYDFITAQIMKEPFALRGYIIKVIAFQICPKALKNCKSFRYTKRSEPIARSHLIFKSLLLRRLNNIIRENNLIPNHQFSFSVK